MTVFLIPSSNVEAFQIINRLKCILISLTNLVLSMIQYKHMKQGGTAST